MTTVAEAVGAARDILVAANSGADHRVDIFISIPKPVLDSDKAAHAYIVLHPSPGESNRLEEPLTASPGARLWRCQATCAGGDPDRALIALQRLQEALVGVQLTDTSGFVREEGDLGPIRPDITVTPNRWYAPVDLAVEL